LTICITLWHQFLGSFIDGIVENEVPPSRASINLDILHHHRQR
jgi:hypothetical protein